MESFSARIIWEMWLRSKLLYAVTSPPAVFNTTLKTRLGCISNEPATTNIVTPKIPAPTKTHKLQSYKSQHRKPTAMMSSPAPMITPGKGFTVCVSTISSASTTSTDVDRKSTRLNSSHLG